MELNSEGITNFQHWLIAACFRQPPKPCEDLAKDAWNHQQRRIERLESENEIVHQNWMQQKAEIERLEAQLGRLCDSNFIAGMKYGWNCAINGDEDGYRRAVEGRINERVAAARDQARREVGDAD